MQRRDVNGPGSGDYVTTAEASKFLGVKPKHFEALARETDWLRPVYFGRVKRWHWFDVVAFAHVWGRQKNPESGAPGEK